MRNAQLMIAAAVLLQATPALARRPTVPVQNYPNEPVVVASGTKLSLEQVTAAALRAAAKRRWAATKVSDAQYSLRLVVRQHVVVVSLLVSPERYGIVYESSENMQYGVEDGVPSIHPKYNQWVRNLLDDIRKELTLL